MNPDDLVKAFVNAGLDTPDKVQSALSDLAVNIEIRRIDIELDSLSAKQADAVKPIQDRRNELNAERAYQTARLTIK